MRLNRAQWTATCLLLLASSTLSADEGWIELFDGQTLNGWIQKNGTAAYAVEDGIIVGRTTEGSPNSFLSTKKDYGNFELLVDVKVDDGLNSGIQIRSQTTDGSNHGRVNGPQVEIESSGEKGAEAGYVYGEATGRGWLTPACCPTGRSSSSAARTATSSHRPSTRARRWSP